MCERLVSATEAPHAWFTYIVGILSRDNDARGVMQYEDVHAESGIVMDLSLSERKEWAAKPGYETQTDIILQNVGTQAWSSLMMHLELRIAPYGEGKRGDEQSVKANPKNWFPSYADAEKALREALHEAQPTTPTFSKGLVASAKATRSFLIQERTDGPKQGHRFFARQLIVSFSVQKANGLAAGEKVTIGWPVMSTSGFDASRHVDPEVNGQRLATHSLPN
jgi:hypothetical protein